MGVAPISQNETCRKNLGGGCNLRGSGASLASALTYNSSREVIQPLCRDSTQAYFESNYPKLYYTTYRQGTYKTGHRELMSYSAFRILGQGSFGVVYLAKNNKNQLIAVKCKLALNNYNLMQKSNVLFRGELEALFNLKHNNIVRLLGIEVQHNDVVSLIMEHIPGVPLDKYIYKCGKLPEQTIQLYTRQIVNAIAYMHSKFVMHRDIKSSNIMLVAGTWIKLIDFGMAKRLYVQEIGFSASTSTMVGTIPFMAPEVRNFQSYNCKADIFSIGALIYEMANGDPFVRVAHEYITETIILSQVRGIVNVPTLSKVANSFMQFCLIKDANIRPSALTLGEHPFISDVTVPSHKEYTSYCHRIHKYFFL